jgi:hypothetical protein
MRYLARRSITHTYRDARMLRIEKCEADASEVIDIQEPELVRLEVCKVTSLSCFWSVFLCASCEFSAIQIVHATSRSYLFVVT